MFGHFYIDEDLQNQLSRRAVDRDKPVNLESIWIRGKIADSIESICAHKI